MRMCECADDSPNPPYLFVHFYIRCEIIFIVNYFVMISQFPKERMNDRNRVLIRTSANSHFIFLNDLRTLLPLH
jgi:hypothetical protein